MFRMTNKLPCIYTQSFASEQGLWAPEIKTLRFVTVVILIKAESLKPDMCSMAAGIDVGHDMSRI